MGKKSIKEDKTIYQIYRESMNFTRSQASERLDFITESRLERIEYGSLPMPEEVLQMSKIYKKPELCNYYCSHECSIGQKNIPEIKVAELPEIVLGILASLNSISRYKDRLVEMAADGKISDDEMKDFNSVREKLDEMSLTIDSFKLWLDKAIANGDIKPAK